MNRKLAAGAAVVLIAAVVAGWLLFFAEDSSPEGVARQMAENWLAGDYEAACELSDESFADGARTALATKTSNSNALPSLNEEGLCEAVLDFGQARYEDDLDAMLAAEVTSADESDDTADLFFEDVGTVYLVKEGEDWKVVGLPFVNAY